MANTFRIESKKANGRYMYLELTQTQNIAANTSTIDWELVVTGGSSNYYSTGATTVKINGEQVYYKKRVEWDSYEFPAAKGSVSGSLTVAHNENGGLSIPVSLATNIYTTKEHTVEDNWTLDNIPRGAILTYAPYFNDEESPTITYSNPAGTAVDSLQLCITFDGTNDDIPYREIDKLGTSYTFNFTENERNILRRSVTTGTRRYVRFYLKTIIGENVFYYRSSDKVFSLLNCFPEVAPTAIDTSERAIKLTGNPNIIIKGYNSVKVTANATAKKGATIQSYLISNGAKEVAENIAYFDYTESPVFTIKATDSRYNDIVETIKIPMIDYIKLTCNLAADIEVTSGTNAKITLDIKGNYFNNTFGAEDNTLSVFYRYKPSSGDYGDWISVNGINLSGNEYSAKAIIEGLDYQTTYIVQAMAVDAVYYGGVVSAEITKKAVPVFDWSGEDFNFNVPVSINGIVIDYIVEQGIKDGWSYRKWSSGVGECWKIVTYTTSINTPFGALYCGNASARQNYPFTFTEKPVEQVTLQSGNTQAFLYVEAGGHGVNGAAASARYNVFKPSAVADNQTFYLSFYVKGNYK